LAWPHKTSTHITPLQLHWDFQNLRAIVLEDSDDTITLTSAQDLAAVVARAVDFEGEWPIVGGINGNKVTVSQILKLGEKIRGMRFLVVIFRPEWKGTLLTHW
jgi:hypothetical protein